MNRPSPVVAERAVSHRRSEIRHKTEVISVRCTPDEKAEIAAWAAAHGKTVSDAMLTAFTVTTLVEAREGI